VSAPPIDPRTPVLVACGEVTDLTTPAAAGRSPYDLTAQAVQAALDDSGVPQRLRAAIDTVAMLRSFADTSPRFASALGGSANPPKSVAQRTGIAAARHLYTGSGGDLPQRLVSAFAGQIARGEARAVLVCGGEALRTQHGVQREGLPVSWAEDPGGTPEFFGDRRRGWSDLEARHGLRAAIAFYPLIENAIRAARGAGVAAHLQSMARLFARFATVAVANPLATRREGFSAERLATVDAVNPWVGFPYPRLMNANAFVDQAAALVVTSVATARELGIATARWVFLHGAAEGHDHWHVSERPQLHRSPAMHAVASRALAMAGSTVGEVDCFDLYSCFPSAVEVACAEAGIAEDDPRGLTLTGGLPFFGGPGNNYVTHAIAAMMRRLRAAPGRFGLVSANGNYLTKHAWGVYSTTPLAGPWPGEDAPPLQAELDRLPRAPLVDEANGAAVIETCTVMHGRQGPLEGIVFGRLAEGGQRFVAQTARDPATLAALMTDDASGRPGRVSCRDGVNRFAPG